ncbi:NAD-dependent epimerase/dehydratase family protein [Marinobacterium sp. xm-d-530]|uniref:NAD-dependent epimerase/dehydratase family protein n=1 Tax=Marinobacterium sp. xm-d-530 TaxID=2497747 RepID=UPI001569F4FB|nr:NAD-dependent epimerase/dehydratase family protein [Marinobacterium sp. xm-d-530]NRQ01191.1 UDP-glucose 4-epimerase [Marinobacterium sp. xm-d-530]
MKVLVTGGLGQIGSHVAEMLLERGDEVLVIDNLATGRREHLAEHERLQIVIDTIADKGVVDDLFDSFQPHAVVHTAASYKDPDDWYNDTLTNCVGGSNIIDAAKRTGVKRFVYFQTALCYGLKPSQQPVRLDHPRLPGSSSYAISKTTNEFYLELSGLDYVTFRLANVVGPRNVAGPLPIFYQRLKDGKLCFVTEARRDFVFVKDLARVVLSACDGVGHGAYHFSSGKDVAIQELYDAVVNAMDLPESPVAEVKALGPDDVFSILLDPTRTFEDFGQLEFTPLETTVREAINYYKEYGTLGEYTHLRLEDKKK